MSDYRLCRREIGPDGKTRLCNKTIRKKNSLDWCDDCRTRLPFWPTEDKRDETDGAQAGSSTGRQSVAV